MYEQVLFIVLSVSVLSYVVLGLVAILALSAVWSSQTHAQTDIILPTLIAPSDMMVEARGDLTYVDIGVPTITNGTGGSFRPTNNGLSAYPIGETDVEWSVVNEYGDVVTATQTITIHDTTLPQFDTSPVLTYVNPVATDIFDVTVSCDPPSQDMLPVGTTTVTCIAMDPSGNSLHGTFDVVITPITLLSTLVIPPNITVEANAVRTIVDIGMATATDSTGASIIPISTALADYPLGETIVEWSATDSMGNTITKNQIITVEDTTPPTVSPAYSRFYVITLGLPQELPANFILMATDIFGATILCDPPLNGLFPIGTTTIACVITDTNGNTIEHSINFRVQLNYDLVPRLSVPSDVVIEATGARTSVTIGTATATDGLDNPLLPTNNAPSDYPIGETIVEWTAIDEAGNTDTNRQKITVRDTIPPEFSSTPRNIIFNTTVTPITIPYDTPLATDLVGVTVSCNPPSQSMFLVGTTTVTCVASDPSGNVSRSAFNVIVWPPGTISGIIVPPDVTVEATAERTLVNIGTATATDSSGVSLNTTNNALTDYPLGVTMVEWSAVDGEGNTFTDTQLVTILDTASPVFTSDPRNIRSVSSADSAIVIYDTPATDIFDVSTECTPPSSSRFALGSTTVTCTATDQSGNTASVSFMVTVVTSDSQSLLLGIRDIESSHTYHHINYLYNEESRQYHDEIIVNSHRPTFNISAPSFPNFSIQLPDSATSITGMDLTYSTLASSPSRYTFILNTDLPAGTYPLLDGQTVIATMIVDGNNVHEAEYDIIITLIYGSSTGAIFYDGITFEGGSPYRLYGWAFGYESIVFSAQDSNGVSTMLGSPWVRYSGGIDNSFIYDFELPDGTYTLYGDDVRLGEVIFASPSEGVSGTSGVSGSTDPLANPDVFDPDPYPDAHCIIFSDSDLGIPADECIILPESAIPDFFPEDPDADSGASGQGN